MVNFSFFTSIFFYPEFLDKYWEFRNLERAILTRRDLIRSHICGLSWYSDCTFIIHPLFPNEHGFFTVGQFAVRKNVSFSYVKLGYVQSIGPVLVNDLQTPPLLSKRADHKIY